MRRIHVMAAVIRRDDGYILIAKRPANVHQGGLWEFPGGKLEDNEPRRDGLARELQEELGIQVTVARPLIDIRHDYPDKSIRLDVWEVSEFSGQAHGAEGQQVRWVSPQSLKEYAFPAANQPIVLAATLPQRYLITPPQIDSQALFSSVEAAMASGAAMVQLRRPDVGRREYEELASQVMARFSDKLLWLLKGEQPPRADAGWHLTARQLRALQSAGWRKGEPLAGQAYPHQAHTWTGLLAASCHDEQELAMAADIGADLVTLSPVLQTRSHPQATPLGWHRAAELIALTNIPVYLLGGLCETHLEKAQAIGAQGIAGISGLWPSVTAP